MIDANALHVSAREAYMLTTRARCLYHARGAFVGLTRMGCHDVNISRKHICCMCVAWNILFVYVTQGLCRSLYIYANTTIQHAYSHIKYTHWPCVERFHCIIHVRATCV